MKKLILLFTCFCLIAVSPVLAQASASDKSVKTEKMHACCKAKGGAENCCKKGMAAMEQKSQCSKKDCAGNCCKDKGNIEKKSWWKFW